MEKEGMCQHKPVKMRRNVQTEGKIFWGGVGSSTMLHGSQLSEDRHSNKDPSQHPAQAATAASGFITGGPERPVTGFSSFLHQN